MIKSEYNKYTNMASSKLDVLEKLFGSAAKVKMMRLFLFNPEKAFENKDISKRAKISANLVRSETKKLEHIKLIKNRVFMKDTPKKPGRRSSAKKKVKGWSLNRSFPYIGPLQSFLTQTSLLRHDDIIKNLSKTAKIKLIIISGVFIQDSDNRVDILVVGDNMKPYRLERAIRSMEAEIGKEIRYAAFETTDFKYRLGMYDKLIRDILDYPHEKVLNKLGVD